MKQSEAESQVRVCKTCKVEKSLSSFRIFNDSRQNNKKHYSRQCDECYKKIEILKIPPKEKVCNKCGILRPIERYSKAPSHLDGRRGICKDCQNESVRNKRKEDILGYRRRKNEVLRKHRRTPRGAMRQRFQAAQRRAKQLGLPFDISLDFLMDLFKKQNGMCALSGLPLEFTGNFWDVLSIDRIIPEKGYVKDNVQLVVNRINVIKGNLPMNELLYICKLILEKGSETISQESTPKSVEAPDN